MRAGPDAKRKPAADKEWHTAPAPTHKHEGWWTTKEPRSSCHRGLTDKQAEGLLAKESQVMEFLQATHLAK